MKEHNLRELLKDTDAKTTQAIVALFRALDQRLKALEESQHEPQMGKKS